MVGKKKDKEVEPNPQDALIKDMDGLDYGAGVAPSSTTTPEAPVVPQDAAPEAPPVEEPSPEVKVGGEPAEPVGGEPTPIAGVQAGEEEPPVAVPVVEVPPVKTVEEILKETQAGQVAHYQKLYEDKAKELEELKAKAAPAEPLVAEAAPKPPTPEEIRRHYEPEMVKVVEEGYLSREFVEDYPGDVAQMLYHRDILYNVSQKLVALEQWASSTIGQQRNTAAESHLNSLLDIVAEGGVHFQPLKDPEVRKAFRGYLDQVNPMCNVDNVKDVISQQYLAFNHQAVLAALTGGASAPNPGALTPPAATTPAPPRNLTMGEHGGTRAGSPGSVKKDPFLAEMDALD